MRWVGKGITVAVHAVNGRSRAFSSRFVSTIHILIHRLWIRMWNRLWKGHSGVWIMLCITLWNLWITTFWVPDDPLVLANKRFLEERLGDRGA